MSDAERKRTAKSFIARGKTINVVEQFESVHPYLNKPLILISGVGRSGTTALTAALAAQPEIDSTNKESNVVRDLIYAARRGATMPSRKKQMIVEPDRFDAIFRRTILELLWPIDSIVNEDCLAISTYSGMNVEEAQFLARLFPQHLLVYIVRNGIEVVSSRMVHRSFKLQPFEAHCSLWNEAVAMARWAEVTEQCVICRHEHFRDHEAIKGVFGSSLATLGIDNLEPMLSFLDQDPKHTTSVPGEINEALAARNERWKYWTEEQRERFADLCRESMEYFGYSIPWLG